MPPRGWLLFGRLCPDLVELLLALCSFDMSLNDAGSVFWKELKWPMCKDVAIGKGVPYFGNEQLWHCDVMGEQGARVDEPRKAPGVTGGVITNPKKSQSH